MLWFFWDDPQLSASAKVIIEEPQNRKLVSISSCWEIAIKVGLGKLDLGESSRSFLPREIARNSFELLPISLAHATMVEQLASHHRDPFDRMLIAQAMTEGLPLVSIDAVFDQYGIRRLW
jgi:PIN domain nuclease of toxin-antitoxin system